MYLKSIEIRNYRKFYYQINNPDSDEAVITHYNRFSFVKAGTTNDINNRTTLIVGQNNSGKTTLAKFLEVISNRGNIELTDINNKYLKEIINEMIDIKKDGGEVKPDNLPTVEGIIKIDISDDRNDFIHNLQGFLDLKDDNLVTINVSWSTEEELKVLDLINAILYEEDKHKNIYNELKDILSSEVFKIKFYNHNGDIVNVSKSTHFLEFKYIKANNVTDDNVLSNSFNKIINDYSSLKSEPINKEIIKINEAIKKDVIKDSNDQINDRLKSGKVNEHIKIELTPNLTLSKILSVGNIKYNYVEDGHLIDEDKFGLGYTRLILILSEILDYVNKYEDSNKDLKVNLIFIEEPEAFMHPQLQKLFMKNLSDLVNAFLTIGDGVTKDINSQLIVSTHSDHILNSKIENSNSFNNINYIYLDNNQSKIKELTNNDVSDKDSLNFIIKHLKNNMEELFFSDGIILVEGVTEYYFIKELLERDDFLSKKYINVYIVGGAYAQVYIKLIEFLNIPSAIITDIDLKIIEGEDKLDNINVDDLDKYKTTNHAFNLLKKHHELNHNNTDKEDYERIEKIEDVFKYINAQPDLNYKIFTQTNNDYENFLPTSFEEALVLDNDQRETRNIVQQSLVKTFPIASNDFINDLTNKSRSIQNRLNNNSYKTMFIKNILELMVGVAEPTITIPKYIQEALEFVKAKLVGEVNDE